MDGFHFCVSKMQIEVHNISMSHHHGQTLHSIDHQDCEATINYIYSVLTLFRLQMMAIAKYIYSRKEGLSLSVYLHCLQLCILTRTHVHVYMYTLRCLIYTHS